MSRQRIVRLDGTGLTQQIFEGDTDTAIVIRLFDLSSNAYNPVLDPCPPPLDVSGSTPLTELQIRFKLPAVTPDVDGVVSLVGATFATATVPALPGFVGDGTDGYIEYRTPGGFLIPGRWRAQGVISLPPGTWSSEIIEFDVSPILE